MIKQRKVPTFIEKTYQILDSGDYDSIICWAESGKSFRILNQDAFIKVVLPTFFKHNKIQSFIRQLNIYGFRKVRKAVGSNTFQHPDFVKDCKFRLKNILRKVKGRKEFDNRNRINSPTPEEKSSVSIINETTSETSGRNQELYLVCQSPLVEPYQEMENEVTSPTFQQLGSNFEEWELFL